MIPFPVFPLRRIFGGFCHNPYFSCYSIIPWTHAVVLRRLLQGFLEAAGERWRQSICRSLLALLESTQVFRNGVIPIFFSVLTPVPRQFFFFLISLWRLKHESPHTLLKFMFYCWHHSGSLLIQRLDWSSFLLYLNFQSWIVLEQWLFSLSVCNMPAQLCSGVQLDFAATMIIWLITAINSLICIPVAHPLRYQCNLQGHDYLFAICLSALRLNTTSKEEM